MSIELLAQPTWDQLDERLRQARGRNPSAAAQIDAIRAPVVTLAQLWRDAPAALGDDPLAIERQRVTLQAAADAAAMVPLALATLRRYPDEGAPDAPPGLIHHGALAALCAAAVRVSDGPGSMQFSLYVVAGLALQCGPAELLARLEPYGAPFDSYDNLVRLSVPPLAAAGVAGRVILRGRARDPIERARWRCVIAVATTIAKAIAPAHLRLTSETFDAGTPNGVPPIWTPASSGEITSVERLDAKRLLIKGRFPWLDNDEWPVDDVVIIGSSPSVRVAEAEILEVAAESDEQPAEITVRFDQPVDWVGLYHRLRTDHAEQSRNALRAALARALAEPCARARPTIEPEVLVPHVGPDGLEPPLRTSSNRVPPAAGAPEVQPGDPDGAPPFVAPPSRRMIVLSRVVALDGGAAVSLERIAGALRGVGAELNLDLSILELPWMEDAAAVVSTAPTSPDDPRVVTLHEALARAAARTAHREDALWLAVVPGDGPLSAPSSSDAAGGLGVATLGGLARCVLELLVDRQPAPDRIELRAGVHRVTAHTFAAMRTPPMGIRPATPRLRLVGRVDGNELTLFDRPREEVRASGHPAPVLTGIAAVSLDAAGAELGRTAITAHRDGGPTAIAALVPVSPEVEAIELRRGTHVLGRIARPGTQPQRATLAVDATDGIAIATWSATRTSAPVELVVEVSDADKPIDWVPVATAHACADSERLPLWRLGRARWVRVVACDGWHAVGSEPAQVPEGVRFGPVVIRRVGERLLYAELPVETQPIWRTEVVHSVTDRRLSLDAARRGPVELELRSGGVRLTDRIELERGDVYRRA